MSTFHKVDLRVVIFRTDLIQFLYREIPLVKGQLKEGTMEGIVRNKGIPKQK